MTKLAGQPRAPRNVTNSQEGISPGFEREPPPPILPLPGSGGMIQLNKRLFSRAQATQEIRTRLLPRILVEADGARCRHFGSFAVR